MYESYLNSQVEINIAIGADAMHKLCQKIQHTTASYL